MTAAPFRLQGERTMGPSHAPSADLAASLTWQSSRQAYWTIRLLVDRDRVEDAFRAYGYFRWLDDLLDLNLTTPSDREAFLRRQQALVDSCYEGGPLLPICPEEQIIIDLITRNSESTNELGSYILNMMDVMAFDADRRGRLISQSELDDYTRGLSVAVTDALHWFIGHQCPSPPSPIRYQAAAGAHIVHMLRDVHDDLRQGYINIPVEILTGCGIGPADFKSPAYRDWVQLRIETARRFFEMGDHYLANLKSSRCRLAGYAYQERFLWILRAIRRANYVLQPDYRTPALGPRALYCLARAIRPRVLSPRPIAALQPGSPAFE